MSDFQPKFFEIPEYSQFELVVGGITIGMGGLIIAGSIFELGALEGTICGAAGALAISVPVWCYQRLRDRTDTAHEANALAIANKRAGDEYVAQVIEREREQAEARIARVVAERDAAVALLPVREADGSGRFAPKPGGKTDRKRKALTAPVAPLLLPASNNEPLTIEGTVEP